MRRRRAALVALVLVAPGCGRERLAVPDTTRPAAPAGLAPQAFPEAGLFLERPGNWPFHEGRPPLVASASSGTATVALWRYARSEPLPETTKQLQSAQKSLEEAARTRDTTFKLEQGRTVKVGAARGVELLGTETVAGQKRRVRSTHLFAHGAEVVLDAYAPQEEWRRVDETVFAPIRKSLRIQAP